LAPSPSTTPDDLAHAAIRALASVDLRGTGADESPTDRLVDMVARSLHVLPSAPARAPAAQGTLPVSIPAVQPMLRKAWCPLFVVPTWSDVDAAARPLTTLLRAVLEAVQACTDVVYVLALDDVVHVPFDRVQFVQAIRHAGTVYADRTRVDAGRVTTVIGLAGVTAACAHALTHTDAFRHVELWLLDVDDARCWPRVADDLDHVTGHPQEATGAATPPAARHVLTWTSATPASKSSRLRLPLIGRATPVIQRGANAHAALRRKTVVLLIHTNADAAPVEAPVRWLEAMYTSVLGVDAGQVRIDVVAVGSGVAAVIDHVKAAHRAANVDMVDPMWTLARVFGDADACVLGTDYVPFWATAAYALAAGVPTVVAADSGLLQQLGDAVATTALDGDTTALVLRPQSTPIAMVAKLSATSQALATKILALHGNANQLPDAMVVDASTAVPAPAPARAERRVGPRRPSAQTPRPSLVWTWSDRRYDVFISFHGSQLLPNWGSATVRTALAEPLWNRLHREQYSVFFDRDALRDAANRHAGTSLDDLLQGILSTRGGGVAVLLLTPGFFQQWWPLIELACLMQLHETGQVRLLPVCIGVTPTMVGKEPFIGAVCPALRKVPMETLPEDCLRNPALAIEHVNDLIVNRMAHGADARGLVRPDSFANMRIALAKRLEPHKEEQGLLAVKLGLSQGFRSAIDLFDPVFTGGKVAEDNVTALAEALRYLFARSTVEALRGTISVVDSYAEKWLAEWTKNMPGFAERYQQAVDWCDARRMA